MTTGRVLAGAGKFCDALERGTEGPALIHIVRPCWQAATCEQCALHSRSIATLSGCSHESADGGCSIPARSALLMTLRSKVRDLAWISVLALTLACSAGESPGTPSMSCGVRSALGPGRFSLSLENSLQGGALQAMPTRPEKQSLVSSRMTRSSNMSCVSRSAKSKGAKKSPPRACNDLESGQFFPAKISKKSLGFLTALGAGAWLCCCGASSVFSCEGCAVGSPGSCRGREFAWA